eukprot:2863780-Rhodomonas_salina.2
MSGRKNGQWGLRTDWDKVFCKIVVCPRACYSMPLRSTPIGSYNHLNEDPRSPRHKETANVTTLCEFGPQDWQEIERWSPPQHYRHHANIVEDVHSLVAEKGGESFYTVKRAGRAGARSEETRVIRVRGEGGGEEGDDVFLRRPPCGPACHARPTFRASKSSSASPSCSCLCTGLISLD